MHAAHVVEDPFRPLALEMRHLRLILGIHDLGGVTRAGERLHLTQSALSHQLREIEDRLGVQLFRRVKRKLLLSDAGERLLPVARRVLGEVSTLEDELRERAVGQRGTLRITTECYTAYHWLPPLLKRFDRQYPDVRIQIVVDATSRPLEALAEGSVDLALVTRVPDGASFDRHPLFGDELLLVVSSAHRLAARRFVRSADLVDERLILYSPPSASLFYSQFFAGKTHAPREVLQVQLTEAMLAMIRAGLGVGALARWAVEPELRRGDLVGVRLGPKGLHREWKAVARPRERLPRYVADFIGLIAAKAGPARFGQRCA